MSQVPLSPDEFVSRFTALSRNLWCLAAGILGCRSQAEDVLQESAMTALKRLDSFRRDSNFGAWMSQIVRFTALNHARRHYRSREVGVVDHLPAHGATNGVGQVVDGAGSLASEQEHFDDSLTRALAQLSEMSRASFLLRTLMGLSYSEISDLLDIPEGTAMSQVSRSRAILRELLESDASFESYAGWRAS
jgi:RNA polymerase sigma-70 factor (ECF subfamily)